MEFLYDIDPLGPNEKPAGKAEPGDYEARLFLDFYLDFDSFTFGNAEQTVRRMYPSFTPGLINRKARELKIRLETEIQEWLTGNILEVTRLKARLDRLTEAKTTKFFAYQGEIFETREVDAHDVQLRALEMAFKLAGQFAPEKQVHEIKTVGPGVLSPELEEKIAEIRKDRRAECLKTDV